MCIRLFTPKTPTDQVVHNFVYTCLNMFTICLRFVYALFTLCLRFVYEVVYASFVWVFMCLRFVYDLFTICLRFVYALFTLVFRTGQNRDFRWLALLPRVCMVRLLGSSLGFEI